MCEREEHGREHGDVGGWGKAGCLWPCRCLMPKLAPLPAILGSTELGIAHFLPSSEPLPVNRLQPRIVEDTKIEDVYKNKKFSLICFWKLRRNLIN